MASVPHEFVTVDMRGLKSALVERARDARVSVSGLVREFVEKGLGQRGTCPVVAKPADRRMMVKLSLRISVDESDRLTAGAVQAGVSRAAYLAELIGSAPQFANREERSARLAALAASNAELATLSRNVRHLVDLIRRGSSPAAAGYARLLDTIDDDLRRHLSLSSAILAEMRPTRRATAELKTGARRNRSNAHG